MDGDARRPQAGQFRNITMYECEAGFYAFGGDYEVGEQGTHKLANARLIRCKSIGGGHDGNAARGSGYAAFAGCGTFANDIDDDCYFEECEAEAYLKQANEILESLR